jgi:hypothetical protein
MDSGMTAYWPYYDIYADASTPAPNIQIVSDNRKLEGLLLNQKLPPELKKMCSGSPLKKILKK